jgi:multidrug resistance efflux pump
MSDPVGLDLSDCAAYPQALRQHPPRIVHGTLILLTALLATALAWSAATRADLVVRGRGRIRPMITPVKVFNAARGEVLSGSVGVRIVEVGAREGDRVRQGDVLVRLETGRLDNEITKQRRAIQSGEEELIRIDHLVELLSRRYETARSKAVAELAQVREEVRRAKEQKKSEIRLAELALESAVREEAPLARQLKKGYIAPIVLTRAKERINEEREKLAMAQIPVDEVRVDVALRTLELTGREYALKREEEEQKRAIRHAEVEAARLELANLELERKQSVIRAPIAGVVTSGDVKVGDVLEPGKPVVEIAAQTGFRFEAAVPSGEMGHLRTGMPARIKLDAYNYQQFGTLAGKVHFISPDSDVAEGRQAAFYTVRVDLGSDEVGRGSYRGRLKLGLTGQAEIVTGRDNLLSLLLKRIRQTISLG